MKLEKFANSVFATMVVILLWGLVPIEEPATIHYAWRIILIIALLWYGVHHSFMQLPQQTWIFLKTITKRYSQAMAHLANFLFEHDLNDLSLLANRSAHLIKYHTTADQALPADKAKCLKTIQQAWQAYGRCLVFISLLNFVFSLILGGFFFYPSSVWGYVMIPLHFLVITWFIAGFIPDYPDSGNFLSNGFVLFAAIIVASILTDLVYVLSITVRILCGFMDEPSSWYSPAFQLRLNFATIQISSAHLAITIIFCLMLFALTSVHTKLDHIFQLRNLIEQEDENIS